MSQLIDHSCPNILCPGFNKSFTVECWDRDEEEFGEGQDGSPCCDDELRCKECDTYSPHSNEVDVVFKKLVGDNEHAHYDGPDIWG